MIESKVVALELGKYLHVDYMRVKDMLPQGQRIANFTQNIF